MLRSLEGKVMKNVLNHAVLHDLSEYSREDLSYIFLLMSIAGNSSNAESRYGFNGTMQIHFPNAIKAISKLMDLGYLASNPPFEIIVDDITVPELKLFLKSHNLPVSGKKDVLLSRLQTAITDEEMSALSKKHERWYPSDLGFEMIYSMYYHFELAELHLLDALKSNNLELSSRAYLKLMNFFPYDTGLWTKYPSDRVMPKYFSIISNLSESWLAFSHICGFEPEFNIHQAPDLPDDEFENARLIIPRAISAERIAHYRSIGVKKIRWHCGDRNPACLARDNKVYSIDHAPVCPAQLGCHCRYTAVVELPGEDVPVTNDF